MSSPRVLASASMDRIIVWNLADRGFQIAQEDCGNVSCLAFSKHDESVHSDDDDDDDDDVI